MAEFTPITSQEQLDSLLASRLERERNSVRKEYADYDSVKQSLADKTKEAETLSGKVGDLTKQIETLNSKVSASETDSAKTRIAYEMGIPFELRSRLVGTTEEEIRKDAEALQKLIGSRKPAAPLFSAEGGGGDAKDKEYRSLLSDIKKTL